MTVPCRKPELYKFSPHQGRMFLLDMVLSYDLDEHIIETVVDVTEKSEFFRQDEGNVPLWISFEYIAESIAVLSGINHGERENDSTMGFIIGLLDFRGEADGFISGDKVSVSVKQSFCNGDVAVFEGETSVGGIFYSRATVSVIKSSRELVAKWVFEL